MTFLANLIERRKKTRQSRRKYGTPKRLWWVGLKSKLVKIKKFFPERKAKIAMSNKNNIFFILNSIAYKRKGVK